MNSQNDFPYDDAPIATTWPRFSLRGLFLVATLVCGFCALLAFMAAQQRRKQPTPLERRARLLAILTETISDEERYLRRRSIDESWLDPANSWRYAAAARLPVPDLDFPPTDLGRPWRIKLAGRFDKEYHLLFCLANEEAKQRTSRFARVMACRGEGSAFDYLLEHDFDSLRKLAPYSILVVEVANSKTPWMQRRDLDLRMIPKQINPRGAMGIGSDFGDGFLVGFVDGEVWALKPSVPWGDLTTFLSVQTAKDASRDSILSPYRIRLREPQY